MPPENSTTDSIRKAAILVSALDRDSADALLDKMGPEQAARVRNAVFELEPISDQEQDEIVREFVSAGGGQVGPMSQDGFQEPHEQDFESGSFRLGEAAGYESTAPFSDASPAAQSRDVPVATDQRDRHDPTTEAGTFPILREASIETLANHLVHENPQVIAVVVAHLPPRRAAELIAQLTPQRQADVLRRVAALDVAAPAAIEILQQQLEAKLTEEIRAQRNRAVGLAAVNSILNAAGSKRHELLNNLTENDKPLSQLVGSAEPPPRTTSQIEPRIVEDPEKPQAHVAPDTRRAASTSPNHDPPAESHFVTSDTAAAIDNQTFGGQNTQFKSETVSKTEPIVFEQLLVLDDAGLALLFREVDPEIALVALAGASPEFVHRAMQPLPSREARTLRRRMERLGPIRLSDIAAAQREVARTAAQLVSDGRLPPLVAPRFAVAA